MPSARTTSPLRSAVDSLDGPRLRYDASLEAHQLGSVLVLAVFDAFNVIYTRKTARYVRLATGGTGNLPMGELPADLQVVLAEEASRLASQFLSICIRAVDYCPPVDLEFAYTADDIERIHCAGKVAILMSVEGGHAIVDDLAILRSYYRVGVRYMTLTHFQTNNWADSSTDRAIHDGLNDYGREVVREMNRLGMMVDISHVSDDTIRDVLEITTKPVIASHSSCRALCDHPRNLPDDLLRAIGQNGGYVGINFYPPFVDQKFLNALRARQKDVLGELNAAREMTPAEMDEKAPERAFSFGDEGIPRPPFDLILDHLDHAVKVAGIDHVGIGSDYDGVPYLPEGLDGVEDYPALLVEMHRRGWSDAEIAGLAGGNLLRALRAAEHVAARS